MTVDQDMLKEYARPAQLQPVDDNDERWVLNFGPQHPATHTTFHFVLELDGERVCKCTPHIGYLHSGFEKHGEHLNFDQYVTTIDRMNYISPMANDIAWHGAVERLMGIEVTPRCRYARTFIAEMARIQDHLLCVGEAALECGAFTAFVLLFNGREKLMDLFEALCGARFTTSWTRTGGAMADIPDGWTDVAMKYMQNELPKILDDCHTLLTRNPIFIQRTKSVGVISAEDAIAWSWTGPVARASGVRRDLRKNEPYLAYEDMDFKVALTDGGDVYSRYLVRLEEMEQSRQIVMQALKKLPDGEINISSETKVPLANKAEVFGSIEGLIHHFEYEMTNRGFESPVSEVYAAQEAPNGELGYYLVGNGSMVAWRAKTRSPCIMHLQAIEQLMLGHTISELVVVLSSLNIIVAELDR